MKLNITKGNWRKGLNNEKSVVCDTKEGTIPTISVLPINLGNEAEDNAALLIDAGNTYQDCELLPSELLKQRNDLLTKLIELRDSQHINITGNDWTEIDLLIKKTTYEHNRFKKQNG
jgi:hypothetical protein